MLRWAHEHDRVISSEAPFDLHLAESGFYTTHQKRRSDAALDADDLARPYETSPELAAFRALEDMGVYTQEDGYSPIKAKESYYTRELKRRTIRKRPAGSRTPRGAAKRKRSRRILGFFGV